ncbi:MAG: peptidoglycan-associated lipoprotein Pal [Thermodesulfobacteriota bacterium]|nr:peptidoglycan-associated lipoprotein Pal [Thermodesulfobacteriota bacterium]
MNPMIKSVCITTALLSSLVLLSSGCSKKSVIPPAGSPAYESDLNVNGGTNINYPSADSSYSESGLAGEESMDSTGDQGIGNLSINSGADPQSEEYQRTYGRSSMVFTPIYFDFDQAAINPEMAPILAANADYMKENLGTAIVIEGNCDERGTSEYNLALGERRAINAKEYLVNLGISPTRIRTVSYGEERPLFTDQNELDWSQNRRADFIVE